MTNSIAEIKKFCEPELATRYGEAKAVGLARLERELSEIENTGIGGTLLAARLLLNQDRVVVARGLSGSLTAYLLGLSEYKPLLDGAEFDFGGFADGYTLRLEVGRHGRNRLLINLGKRAAPLACPVSGDNAQLFLHPRLILVSYNGQNIDKTVKLVDADGANGTEKGAVGGDSLPEGIARLEIAESSGVALLQGIMDALGKTAKLPEVGEQSEPDGAERFILHSRLNYFQAQNPLIFYAAGLTVAHPTRRAQIAQTVRGLGIKLLPPALKQSKVEFTTPDNKTLLSGFIAVLDETKAAKLCDQTDYQDLNDLIQRTAKIELNAEDWERLAWSGALDAFGEREAVIAALPNILSKAEEYRVQMIAQEALAQTDQPAKPAQMQLSLFDVMETSQPGLSVPEVAPFVLPKFEGEINHFKRLQQQKIVLGYDTAVHPLWDLLNEAENPTTQIIPLNEALKAETNVVIAGLVEDLRRVTLAAGEELTILKLNDLNGRAELILPPKLVSTGVPEIGAVLSARVRRSVQGETAVLIAENVMSYPPQASELVPTVEETVDFAVASDNTAEPPPEDEPPLPDEPPPLGTGADWMQNAIFDLEAAKAITENQKNGDNKGKKEVPAPKKIIQVHIYLPVIEDATAEENLIKQVYDILRRYPGEQPVNLYLPKTGGGFYHFEPQTTQVRGDADLVAALAPLIGGTDKIKVE
jgi:Helix-hairpin-helix motif